MCRDAGRRWPEEVSTFSGVWLPPDSALPGRLRNLPFIHSDAAHRAGSTPGIDFLGAMRWLHPPWGRTSVNQVQGKGWTKPTTPTKSSAP